MNAIHAIVEVAFAVPVVKLALDGTLVNPAFAAQIGYPPLAEGDAPVMLAIAVVTTLVTGWEILSVFIRARDGRALGATLRDWRRSV